MSNVLNPVQAFYRWAIDRDELAYNPAERIDLPGDDSKRPARIASAEEAKTLLAALEPEDRPLWATAFYAGLRRGELQALRCCDVDLGRQPDSRRALLGPGGGARSTRSPTPAAAPCRCWPSCATTWTSTCCEPSAKARTSCSAEPLGRRSSFVARRAVRERKRARGGREAGREATAAPITLHECRHTFASLLIDAGANPKAIQTFMGHSKIQTTFDTYGHLLPGSHDEVRERMDAYLARQPAALAA